MPELENAKYEQFAREYLRDFNATLAGQRCGYSENYGRDLLRDPAVKARISELRDEQTLRTQITADRIALEYARMAFHDARDVQAVLDALEAGASLEDLPREVTAPIREITRRIDVKGNVTHTVKAHDKYRALDVLRERYWTVDEADDALVTGIQALRASGDVPDMSEASDVASTHNTRQGDGLDDIPDTATGDDSGIAKWYKGRP